MHMFVAMVTKLHYILYCPQIYLHCNPNDNDTKKVHQLQCVTKENEEKSFNHILKLMNSPTFSPTYLLISFANGVSTQLVTKSTRGPIAMLVYNNITLSLGQIYCSVPYPFPEFQEDKKEYRLKG